MRHKTLPALALLGITATLAALSAAIASEAPVEMKQAPGLAELTANCSGCHSMDYVRMNAPFLSQQAWTAEVAKMRGAYGAAIDDADAARIIAYLAENYGPAT